MAPERSLLVVGGGKMGEALVAGLLRTAWATPEGLVVAETDASRRADLAARHPGIRVVAEPGGVAADGAVLAVKPADAEVACQSLRRAGTRRVLSIAAGVTLGSLQSWLGPSAAVVRAMPNTAALVGSGAAAIAGGDRAGGD